MTFSSIQLLDVHKAIHQLRAFNCEFCNYSAKYENDLKRHLIKVHEDKNNKADWEFFVNVIFFLFFNEFVKAWANAIKS